MQEILQLAHGLTQLVREHNYAALYLLLSVEEAGLPLPLPGDTVVAYAGYLSNRGDLLWWVVLLLSVAGSITGSLPLCALSRARGRPLLLRYGKYIHLSRSREQRIEGWIRRNAFVAIFVGRIVPGMRVGTTAIAGVFEIPMRSYFISLTLSAFAWWGFWLWIGAVVGHRLAPLVGFSQWQFALAALVIVGAATLVLYLRSVERAAREEAAVKPPVNETARTRGIALEPAVAASRLPTSE